MSDLIKQAERWQEQVMSSDAPFIHKASLIITALVARVKELESETAYCGQAQIVAKDRRIVELEHENKELIEALSLEVGPEMWHVEQVEKAREQAAREVAEIINQYYRHFNLKETP